jgi:glycosyltransferase domain-containing protein
MSASAQLTILLTLKDRVSFTHRWLDYAVAVALPFRILIADGGTDPGVAEAVAARKAKGLDVEYLRYPADKTYADYYAKVAGALSRVTTPMVVLADNDDLFIREGLTQAAQFLTDHPDYIACGGQCAVFWVSGEPPSAGPAWLYGRQLEWKCSSQVFTDVGGTARQRLRDRSLGANDVFYAVHRTESLRRQLEAVRDFNPRDLFLVEQTVMFLTAIAGKTRQLDVLYIARQQDSPGSSGGAHQEQFGDWYDRMLAPTWSDDFAGFVDVTARALARADGLDEAEARGVVRAAYKASVAPSLLSDLLAEPTVTFSMPLTLQVVRRLVRLPRQSRLRRAAQALYRQARWLSHDFVHGTEFRTRRSREAAIEFKPVRDFLTGPHHHS